MCIDMRKQRKARDCNKSTGLTKDKSIELINTACKALIITIVVFVLSFFLSSGMLAYMLKTDLHMYLASGNTLTGKVTEHRRSEGKYILLVDVKDYGEVPVVCSVEDFRQIEEGTEIVFGFDFMIIKKQEGLYDSKSSVSSG